MYDVLFSEFNVIQAVDGEDGFKKALINVPDIIITDIMMPKKNGIELTKEIKQNLITSHIPVILLSAKTTLKDQLSGISTGAIEYITKPFSVELLKLKINNLLKYRKDLQRQFGELNKTNSINQLDISKYDQEFIENCINIINENILIAKFGIPEMAEAIGMSKTQLYNKIKAITDQSPGEFIREIKLKKAASMLIEERLSVSEVAYSLGFNNRSHFSRTFYNYFGMNPLQYKNNMIDNNRKQ